MKILLAGDSTVASYEEPLKPLTGWGEVLTKLLASEDIAVKNHAYAGRTTRTFMEEGRFEALLAEVGAGDLVLIQFGHNDQNPKNGVSLNEFYERLKKMVLAVKAKKGDPILCTPPEQRLAAFGKTASTLAPFVACMKRLAKVVEVPVFDLNRYTMHLYQEYGWEGSKDLFLWTAPGESDHYPAGSKDNTHFSQKGAYEIARFVAIRLQEKIRQQQGKSAFSKYYYGACMYPEVWSKEIFETDVAHMEKIGMNFARIGEFAWEAIEPEEGRFDLSLLEYALEVYQKHHVDVCLCIPTPTPPRWFTKKYPDSAIKNVDGTTMTHGSRQHVCTNNEAFRRYAYRMTRKVAQVAGKYDNVIMIQLDNEFKCHVDLCYCETCQSRWSEYLEAEYQSIGWLNRQWGTDIWSERYEAFSDVVMPTTTPFLHNSSLMNAFRKFTVATLNEFAHDLCDFVRMETGKPITHNSGFGFNLMNDELFADIDIAGFDTYPAASNYPAYTMNVDRWRNVKPTTHESLLLETCTSHAGHIDNYIPAAPEGWITAEFFAGFAGNLRLFNFWHFRNHRYGVEQPHSAVVTAWGEPDVGYEDVVANGKMLKEISPYLAESTYQSADVGLMYSDNSKRFYTIDSGHRYNYRGLITDYYAALTKSGVNVELIQENSDFSGFSVLVVPYVRFISPTLLAKFKEFVARGGKLILGPMTGDRTEELAWPEKNGLDRIGEWLKITQVQQFSVRNQHYTTTYQGVTTELGELITTFAVDESWEILATTRHERTIAAKKTLGKGEVLYIGGQSQQIEDDPFWKQFIASEIAPFDKDRGYLLLEEGIKKYRRETIATIQFYVVNLSGETAGYDLLVTAKDRLNGGQVVGPQKLAPYDYQILEIAK